MCCEVTALLMMSCVDASYCGPWTVDTRVQSSPVLLHAQHTFCPLQALDIAPLDPIPLFVTL
jgi:hypothetical protein